MLLAVVFLLFSLVGVNAVYLGSITLLEWLTGGIYQNYFYQFMFLGHLVLGLALIGPVVVFGTVHLSRAWGRPNRRAVRAGLALFVTSLTVLATGVVLMRLDGLPVMRDPTARRVAYWIHVLGPLVVVWLFVLHRLAGQPLRWRIGVRWAGIAVTFAVLMILLHGADPRRWDVLGPKSGERYFFPSLARTATGDFIPARALVNDHYCLNCHADVHQAWTHSAHRFSSFNNPAYLFSVLQTRAAVYQRDGHVQASRFCAGCHDPVPFFSGAFDDPKYDDPTYDLAADVQAQAGITCTVCHSVTRINSPRGNADFTIGEPEAYPFTYSDHAVLQYINHQLIKAKPAFHKKTFLKPLHRTPEFCGSCHKVHLPEELNHYKFLRGQNHYDTYQLSGVSGHGVSSYYYPPSARHNCNGCHMPLSESADFGAKDYDGSGLLTVHNHRFPAANTALAHLLGMPQAVIDEHQAFLQDVARVDIFGIREGGTIDGVLHGPIGPDLPALRPGADYLLEVVLRTVNIGHPLTQGTADSNELWVELEVSSGARILGRSGGLRPPDGAVDPQAHFVNAFVIDREGQRINRRNPEDIFVAVYDHQIPPGAADVVHYRLQVPPDLEQPVDIVAHLRYRKFDAEYMKLFQGPRFAGNDLPISTLAVDRVRLPIGARAAVAGAPQDQPPLWERWNDYGIGLLRKQGAGSHHGQLRQAEHAFAVVESLGRAEGPLNRARVYLKEGRLDEAAAALRAAAAHQPPAAPWSLAWFSGLVNKQQGHLDAAVANFESLLEMRDTAECRARGFDFTQDYRLLNELGQTLMEQAQQQRRQPSQSAALYRTAIEWFQRTLALDPENVTAHYNLARAYAALGIEEQAEMHRQAHARYKPDDNARDRAVAAARRRYPAANHAAEAVVIYELVVPSGALSAADTEAGRE